MAHKKFTSYETAMNVFDYRGLVLKSTKEEFNSLNLQNDKLTCVCKNHPEIELQYFYSVVNSGRFGCKLCRDERKTKRVDMTYDEKMLFIQNKGYIYVSGDVSKILNRIDLICPNGHSCNSTINDLLRQDCVCNICNGKRSRYSWNIEKCQEFIDSSDSLQGYKILDIDYSQNDLRVFIQCANSMHAPYWTSWNHLYKEQTICKECYYDFTGKVNWTLDKAKNVFGKYGFKLVDDDLYVSSHKRVACYDKLGFIFMVSLHYILRGREKFALWKGNTYAVHNIKQFCKLFRPDYEFLSEEYIGYQEMYRWKYIGDCLNIGDNEREFYLSLDYFVNAGCGHPLLSKSRLEAKCHHLLNKYNISFKPQKTFDGCKDKNKLRFDFYFIHNGIEICIETDGNQHKYPCEKFDGIDGFLKTQKHDQIKTSYCEKNNIKLIRIPESEFKNMENILIKELQLST